LNQEQYVNTQILHNYLLDETAMWLWSLRSLHVQGDASHLRVVDKKRIITPPPSPP
jgi:hypothetical protein